MLILVRKANISANPSQLVRPFGCRQPTFSNRSHTMINSERTIKYLIYNSLWDFGIYSDDLAHDLPYRSLEITGSAGS